MECREKNVNATRRVVLIFKRMELLYDIENYSYVEGDIMETANDHARHQVMDVGQSGNEDRVTRVLGLAHSECVEMLYPYTKYEVTDASEVYNTMNKPDAYRIEMELPESFSMTTVQLLKHLIHEYLVSRVLADWMSITNPGSAANWAEKFRELKSKIQTSLVSRTGKIRRKCKPFA